MIKDFALSKTGYYHIKNNLPNQDAYSIQKIDERFVIGAVCDGLGSEKHSDIAAQIASRVVVNYCATRINRSLNNEQIFLLMKEAFQEAQQKIVEQTHQDDIDQYDTTLALAVFIDGNVYYANVGDSGILAMDNQGYFHALTTQQNDDYGYVYPLNSGETKWEFGMKENIATVLLATDGLYNLFFPFLLKDQDIKIYTSLAKYFMVNSDQEQINQFIDSLTAEKVNDDRTLVILKDDAVNVTYQPDSYYQTPDWQKLKKEHDEAYFRKAYPSLFTENKQEEKPINTKEKEQKNGE